MPRNLKTFLTFSLAIILLTATLAPVSAQLSNEKNLAKAKGDYSFQLSRYQDKHEDYLTARSTYISFQTTISKENALNKTKDMLSQIFEVYIAYLLLTKEYGNSFTWNKNDTEKDEIFQQIDEEIEYFRTNKPEVNEIKILEDTIPFAENLKNHVNTITLPMVNNSLAVYEVAESEAVYEDFRNLSDDLNMFSKSRIDEVQYSSFFANWESEITDIKEKTEQQVKLARDGLDADITKAKKNRLEIVFPAAEKAKKELLRSIPLFREILKLK